MTRRHEVVITDDARRDLEEIFDHIATTDSDKRAIRILDRLLEIVDSLELMPSRGAHPKELLELGDSNYRQVHFKPYRLLYHIEDRRVVVALIADGRRDFQTLLARRLLSG